MVDQNGTMFFWHWAFLAFAVERMVEVTVKIFPRLEHTKISGLNTELFLAFLYALVIAYGAGCNFFNQFGIPFNWQSIEPAITALFLAGGSSLIHDLQSWVKTNKNGGVL